MKIDPVLATARTNGYGRAIAGVYDDWYGDDPELDTEGAVDALAGLCAGGTAVELGVGTGRLAIPLARRGIRVIGVDVSAEMLDVLRANDTGGLVAAHLGDAATFAPPGVAGIDLVYMVFNGFLCLTTQESQESCLRRCRELLAPDGRLVLETMVMPPGLPPGIRWQVVSEAAGELRIQVSMHDPEAQVLLVDTVVARPDGVTVIPNGARYLSPAQLDAMAGRCGLQVSERWSDWRGTPADDASPTQVTILRPARVG